ncbi:MAG: Gfo/Idh/MocA family oxidoreductase [Burkholderiales bacterium]|nr:Gfo/Idh/MocA family oxidoreductase [Burkholderiales bacterium]MCE7876319.1 gfo/Idh/MocA family oxidoreductase [Betaproteobacteria bacterium PRO3]
MTARRPRVGVLSFAHYHANFWSEVFASRGVLSGIWDDDAARGSEAAARFGTRFEASLDALLERCDAVAVCSETARHAALVDAASARGRAILCEKPLGTGLGDAEAIARIVASRRTWFMQSFPKRFDPATARLREAVAGGELGRITLARIRHGHFYGLAPDFAKAWYARRALAGGGALLDEGVHAADLLALLFGSPSSVVALTSRAALSLEVEDLGLAVFRWPDGMLGEIASSFTYAAADASIELYGTRGTMLVSAVDLASRDITSGACLRRFLSDSPERRWETLDIVPRFKQGEFHHQNAIAFVEALERGHPPPIGIEAGVAAARMIDAAYRAAESGVRIDL